MKRSASLPLPLALLLTVTATVATQAAPRLSARSIKHHSRAQRLDIEAQTPHLNSSVPNARRFNLLAQSIVNQRVTDFRKDALDYTKDSPVIHDKNFRNTNSEIDLAYSTGLVNRRYVSLLIAEYTYFLGAIHPNTNTFALNYDLQTGKRLSLGDIFKPGTNYLGVLSNYSTRVFKAQLKDDGFFPDGTTPKTENFRSWTLTPTGLALHFDAYQVTSYANGPQDLFLSYESLGSIIRPEVVQAARLK